MTEKCATANLLNSYSSESRSRKQHQKGKVPGPDILFNTIPPDLPLTHVEMHFICDVGGSSGNKNGVNLAITVIFTLKHRQY